ncbi:hypothetical protein [Aurantiacibacter marinus]|uniref:Uncharacterized protein n=1 Tax=Aurantiacibacter marinus TaxID=874156 RepID=A0A0H0XUG2_9SPHN|nr:hypothetical protein [Aurantiacibacter marinus]KLI63915.1 hypothetical protein AAV99_09480 [Aurantiacibacter marinus]
MTQKSDWPENDAQPSFARSFVHLMGWGVVLTFGLIGSLTASFAALNTLAGDTYSGDWGLLSKPDAILHYIAAVAVVMIMNVWKRPNGSSSFFANRETLQGTVG